MAIDGLFGSGSDFAGGEIRVGKAGFNATDAERAYRLRDVLELLLAEILEAQVEAVLDVAEGAAGDADGARLGKRLQPRCYVHAIAQDVVALDDHLIEIDAHAELDAPVEGHVAIALAHALLDRDRALDRPDHAREFDQGAIAAGAHEPAAMPADLRIHELPTVGLERSKGGRLILPHQATVAHDVQCEDRSEPAFHRETPSSARASREALHRRSIP